MTKRCNFYKSHLLIKQRQVAGATEGGTRDERVCGSTGAMHSHVLVLVIPRPVSRAAQRGYSRGWGRCVVASCLKSLPTALLILFAATNSHERVLVAMAALAAPPPPHTYNPAADSAGCWVLHFCITTMPRDHPVDLCINKLIDQCCINLLNWLGPPTEIK
jgi:hypothetical protein